MATKNKNQWNLAILYKSPSDPKIEEDMKAIEAAFETFSRWYGKGEKKYLVDASELLQALNDYEKLAGDCDPLPLMYFYSLKDMDSENSEASAKFALLSDRYTRAANKSTFFAIALGSITEENRKKFLEDASLAHFHVFLSRIFSDSRHYLSEKEENIMNFMHIPGNEMWVMGNERVLNGKTVKWKGKKVAVNELTAKIQNMTTQKERHIAWVEVAKTLENVAEFSEAEINAVYTYKKMSDELRGYKTPYEQTVLHYRNEPEVVMKLVSAVTKSASVPQRFYRLKAKMLKLRKLYYSDRGAKIGKIKRKFSFDESVKLYRDLLTNVDAKLPQILDKYLANGQIDVYPRVGKHGGAYCHSTYRSPTLLLLNHIDELYSYSTLAHEMGHAIHGELSRKQGPIYSEYSMVLAETASTFFESLAVEALMEKLTDKEKIILLHDRLNDDMATIWRQIACFNYEKDLHEAVRTKGYVPKEEICELHNRNMNKYLGPVFSLKPEDGYQFVQWSHIRRHFYVYSYAFGMLVSKALLRRYKADKKFWARIEEFLSSGGNDSPENILAKIGIDVRREEFWLEGIREIEENVKKLEELTKSR